MVDSLVPELELSAWEGQLCDLEVPGSFSGSISSVDERRPRIIAAAAGPMLPDGTNRRRRLFIVEPLGMWVKDGQAIAENQGLKTSAAACGQVLGPNAIEQFRDSAPSVCPIGHGMPLSRSDVGGLEPCCRAYNSTQILAASGPQQLCSPGGADVSLHVQPPPQPKYQQVQQQPPRLHEYNMQQRPPLGFEITYSSSCEDPAAGFPGPVRRLASAPAAATTGGPLTPQQAVAAAARFQPYAASRYISAAASGLPGGDPGSSRLGQQYQHQQQAATTGGLHLIMPQGAMALRRRGSDGGPNDTRRGAVHHPTSSRMRDGAPLPQLMQVQQQQHYHSQHQHQQGHVLLRDGSAMALWHKWVAGEEVPLEGSGGGNGGGGCGNGTRNSLSSNGDGSSSGGGGGCVNGGMPLAGTGGPVRFHNEVTASETAPDAVAGHRIQSSTHELLPSPPIAAAAIAAAAAAAMAVPSHYNFQHPQLMHLQQQQQQQQQGSLQRSSSDRVPRGWTDGCEEIWAEAFGPPGPQQELPLPLPHVQPQQANPGVVVGWGAGPDGHMIWPPPLLEPAPHP
ncbi:hypothetical protein Vretimale_778 [Volvox reticuliferus]|uniref:Uncharacterized protein n=1 Tax=Volvox reticuliferus TaxID=1737510 RepID=A0A8J4BYG2_9CHLO|nr:hypothetical protein Vretifemale_2100 [Volvox reticuliferus]GIL94550.1 hypothetical protein Vretimale_778 [Volvox reticuliferus]